VVWFSTYVCVCAPVPTVRFDRDSALLADKLSYYSYYYYLLVLLLLLAYESLLRRLSRDLRRKHPNRRHSLEMLVSMSSS
jgi:hypothetical protein